MRVYQIDKDGVIMWGVAVDKLRIDENEIPAVIRGFYPSLVIPISLPSYLYPIWKVLDEVELKEFPYLVYASLGTTGRGNPKLIWEDTDTNPDKAIIIATVLNENTTGVNIVKKVRDQDLLYHFIGVVDKEKNFILDFGVFKRVFRYEYKDLKEVNTYVSKK